MSSFSKRSSIDEFDDRSQLVFVTLWIIMQQDANEEETLKRFIVMTVPVVLTALNEQLSKHRLGYLQS